jgi:hypothetical protein
MGEKRYWLRGGWIGLIIGILSLVLSLFFYFSSGGGSGGNLFLVIGFMFSLVPALNKSLGFPLPDVFAIISGIVIGLVLWFVVGAIIGLIIGKIKSRGESYGI